VASLDDLRTIASKLEGVQVNEGAQFALSLDVKGKPKGLLWAWMERADPKKARVPNNDVMAVRVPSLSAKEVILSSNPDVYFTEAHYNGFPAVLVRLAIIDRQELEDLVGQAYETVKEPHKTRKPKS
jgi:hypothetical protein